MKKLWRGTKIALHFVWGIIVALFGLACWGFAVLMLVTMVRALQGSIESVNNPYAIIPWILIGCVGGYFIFGRGKNILRE